MEKCSVDGKIDLKQGKLIMYEDTLIKKYILRDKKGKVVIRFNKSDGQT